MNFVKKVTCILVNNSMTIQQCCQGVIIFSCSILSSFLYLHFFILSEIWEKNTHRLLKSGHSNGISFSSAFQCSPVWYSENLISNYLHTNKVLHVGVYFPTPNINIKAVNIITFHMVFIKIVLRRDSILRQKFDIINFLL